MLDRRLRAFQQTARIEHVHQAAADRAELGDRARAARADRRPVHEAVDVVDRQPEAIGVVGVARDTLKDLDLMREKDLLERLMQEIRKPDGGLATYGEAQVRHALELGAVDTLLVSEGLRRSRAKLRCGNCGRESEATVEDAKPLDPCSNCGEDKMAVQDRRDVVVEFTERATTMGTRVELVSRESEEGELLLRAFGGLAAILRYRVT